jgi:hypothetical protein
VYGRLHLGKRTILLAEPVRVRLAAYLDYRSTRWPSKANPHLFIRYLTALGTAPVGARWPGLILGTATRDIRTDRTSTRSMRPVAMSAVSATCSDSRSKLPSATPPCSTHLG